MTDLDAVSKAVTEWAASQDPDAPLAILIDKAEAATLHYMLALLQHMLETTGTDSSSLNDLGSLRKKVEKALVQAGYGGDPRP